MIIEKAKIKYNENENIHLLEITFFLSPKKIDLKTHETCPYLSHNIVCYKMAIRIINLSK